MSIANLTTLLGDGLLSKLLPNGVAEADQDDCVTEFRCGLDRCGDWRLRKYARWVCAGYNGPSYGTWLYQGCCG